MTTTQAQKAILEVLTNITPTTKIGTLEYQRVLDTERHHYQLVVSGWQQGKRVHGIFVQMDIRDGLIWIQEDGIDVNLANELVQLGISEDKIVLAYHVPNLPNTNNLTAKSVR